MALRLGRSTDWVHERTGVHTRHVAGTLKDPAILAAAAARPVVERHGEPDLLLYAGAIPRQMLPETSLFVHRELGLSGTPSFSVNSVCLSFLTALKTSEALIGSGDFRRILICCAELASRGRNFEEPESAALLGDGAAAVMVEATDDRGAGFDAYRMQTWSEGVELTGVRGGGTWRPPDAPDVTPADHLFHMDGEALLRLTVPHLRRFLDDFLREAGITASDIDLVVPHQPSGPGLRLLTRWGFPEDRVVNIIADYGNCVAASMPMALAVADTEGRIKRGDRILFLGTAAGVSIGAGLFRW
ncbi:MAG: 3-oxoacyl-[acyl-carrier-protein] synthase III C-terminal domain-containing protein [Planctomycetaceae bacterium]